MNATDGCSEPLTQILVGGHQTKLSINVLPSGKSMRVSCELIWLHAAKETVG
jgi:hypothetical protein